jgi:hypothetical protein
LPSSRWSIAGALGVAVVAFLSFDLNAFRVVPASWFASHQVDSEQLVLDGVLHALQTGGAHQLGRYSRPQLEAQYVVARDLYAQRDTAGTFERYASQFGLQGRLFGSLADRGFGRLWELHAVAAALLSLVVAGLYWAVRRDFGTAAALGFSAALILSPWMVVFARNLYWFPATWFLPTLIAMYFAPRIYTERSSRVWMLALIFSAYLLKLLCGYEYVTTIAIATCVPLIYHGARLGSGSWRILGGMAANGVALVAAFGLALALHAHSLSKEGGSGWAHVVLVAKKRVASDQPEETARQVCDGDPKCERQIAESLTINPVIVTARYFAFRDFVPWLGTYDLDEEQKEASRSLIAAPSLKQAGLVLQTLGTTTAAAMILNALLFMVFVLWLALALRTSGRPLQLALGCAFLAPLSWFVLAKGHSYSHYHLNYVLWYLPFIPYGVLVIVRHLEKQMDSRAS